MVRAATRAFGYCVVVWRRTLTMSNGWPVKYQWAKRARKNLSALNFSLRRKRASNKNILKIFEPPIFGTRDIKLYALVMDK